MQTKDAASARHTAGITTRLIVTYVRSRAGEAGVRALLARARVPYSAAELQDERSWFSHHDEMALLHAAAEVLDDPMAARHIGEAALEQQVGPGVKILLRALGSPRRLLQSMPRAAARFSTVGTWAFVGGSRDHGTVEYRINPDLPADLAGCEYTAGLLTQIPLLFGLPPATVVEESCQARGGECCRFRVRWQRRSRLFGRRRRVADLQDRLDAATALETARRRGETADALLSLARRLADPVPAGDVAERVAAAIPDVVEADHAAVMLCDLADGTFRMGGLVGFSPELLPALRSLQIRPSDTPELEVLMASSEPRFYRPDTADPFIRGVMESAGTRTSAVVPIRSRQEVLGLAVAGWREDVQLDPERIERLIGLAGQAAAALQNAQLLEEMRRRALEDELTKLPNRVLFEDRLAQALARARRRAERVAVASLDLDRFKQVNDSLGHAAGNELLREVGRRLTMTLRGGDTVARAGGDEFMLLLPDVRESRDLSAVAEKVRRVLARPFRVDGHNLFITASIGLAVHPEDGDTPERLLRNADAAMYRAKELGRNTTQLYASNMNASAPARLAMEGELHAAFEREEFRVHYQPQVELTTGRVVAVEALARWQHPNLGLVPPDQFLSIAEETGLIVDLDLWVLRTAAAQVRTWELAGLEKIGVAVNLSERTLRRGGLVESVLDTLVKTGLDPARLELEITERVAGEDGGTAAATLSALKQHGLRVAVDDFGTGYSSLSRLRRFPADTLKIDRSFIAEIEGEDDEAPIVSGVMAIARGLGLAVVAEGVETQEQERCLVRLGCTLAQGYLLGRPATPLDVEVLLRPDGTSARATIAV
jgi:diguanylate cyclase (GGDEF)-like protein